MNAESNLEELNTFFPVHILLIMVIKNLSFTG